MISIIESNKKNTEWTRTDYEKILTDINDSREQITYDNCFDEDDDDEDNKSYWIIPGDQAVKIMNRIADIREVPNENPIDFIKATYDLLGTLDTILFDERNYRNVKEVK